MTGPPLVSVLIAARNEARRIGECLESLRRQAYTPLEIIVVDDGSTDDTAAIAARVAGVRVLRRAHAGKARAIAAAADAARGGIFCLLDADMVFEPDYVAALVAPIVAGQEVGTSHGVERVANPDNAWSACWQRRAGLPRGERLVLTPRDLAEGSIVFRAVRADAFRRVGGFDDVGYMDDQTLSPKLGRRARWVMDARCRHYNVETLAEVAALGRWAAQSPHFADPRARRAYAAWRIVPHALAELVRHRSIAMGLYAAAYHWGVYRARREGAPA